jgi:hypothetical protein
LFVTDLYGKQIGEYDATTGGTVNASLVSGLDGPETIVVVVPEPATWTLLLVGLSSAFGLTRRWR